MAERQRSACAQQKLKLKSKATNPRLRIILFPGRKKPLRYRQTFSKLRTELLKPLIPSLKGKRHCLCLGKQSFRSLGKGDWRRKLESESVHSEMVLMLT